MEGLQVTRGGHRGLDRDDRREGAGKERRHKWLEGLQWRRT